MKPQRTVMVNIRLTELERDRLTEIAESEGRTLSGHVRFLVQKAAEKPGAKKRSSKRLTA